MLASICKAALTNISVSTEDQMTTCVWKGSHVTNPQRLIRSSELYRPLQHLLAHCFDFAASSFTVWSCVTALISTHTVHYLLSSMEQADTAGGWSLPVQSLYTL